MRIGGNCRLIIADFRGVTKYFCMQFQKRTVVLLFIAGLLFGLIVVLLGRGFLLYREKKLASASERYREVYHNPVIIDTNVSEAKKSYVSDSGIAVARYPHTAYAGVNEDIEKFIDEAITLFLGDFPVADGPLETKHTLFISYESSTIPGYAVSFLFRLSAVYVGSPHPADEIVSRSYDLASSLLLSPEDIFSDVPFALREISRIVTADLLSRPELAENEEWVLRGAAPSREGYKNFTLGPDSITFHFSPYQVGPYSIGTVLSEISYSQIRDLFKDDFLGHVKL